MDFEISFSWGLEKDLELGAPSTLKTSSRNHRQPSLPYPKTSRGVFIPGRFSPSPRHRPHGARPADRPGGAALPGLEDAGGLVNGRLGLAVAKKTWDPMKIGLQPKLAIS